MRFSLIITFFTKRRSWTVYNWFVYTWVFFNSVYIYPVWKVIEPKFHPHAFERGQRTYHQGISLDHTISYCVNNIVDVLSHHMVSTRDRPLIYTLKNVYLKDQRTCHDYQSLTYAEKEISVKSFVRICWSVSEMNWQHPYIITEIPVTHNYVPRPL